MLESVQWPQFAIVPWSSASWKPQQLTVWLLHVEFIDPGPHATMYPLITLLNVQVLPGSWPRNDVVLCVGSRHLPASRESWRTNWCGRTPSLRREAPTLKMNKAHPTALFSSCFAATRNAGYRNGLSSPVRSATTETFFRWSHATDEVDAHSAKPLKPPA